jgi:hypothetical protein
MPLVLKVTIQGVFMKKIILGFSMLLSASAFAQMPNAQKVVASILKDSGLNEVSQLKLTTADINDDDFMTSSLYKVSFVSHGSEINCLANVDIIKREIKPGEYMVQATVDKCFDQTHFSLFKLNNDYTNKYGSSVFRRMFLDNNTRFRPLTAHESMSLQHVYLQAIKANLPEEQMISDREDLEPAADDDVIVRRPSHK